MTYQPSHRKPREPRWHDRPRAWLSATWNHLRGWDQEEQPLTDDHGNHIGEDLPPVRRWPQPARKVIRTAEIGDGVYVPLSGDQWENPRVNCAFAKDLPRPGTADADGPRQLTMWDIITCRDPWPPRPEPVTWSGARVPRYVLAGA